MKEKHLKGADKQVIFDARAKELAKVLDEKAKSVGDSFLVFCLGEGEDEKYALSYQYVERVIPLQHLTNVPGAPQLFLGITYYNAQVWPVVSTEVLFNFDGEKVQPEYVILVRKGAYRYALSVRHVVGHQYLNQAKDLVQLAGSNVKKNHYILGVCHSDISVVDDKGIFDAMEQFSLANEEGS
ncbi:MAG: chemotaxis protein CheW [Legionellaceae bacterium]|nr:chemotaxis protein CheW [Legionellaceae bacterium]